MKQTSFIDLSKKRKLQDEQLIMPLPKHICSNRSLECNSEPCLTMGEINGLAREYETYTESAKDRNSFTRDSDSVNSISGEAKSDLGSPKTFSSDQASTSSVSSDSFKNSLYSLESRSLTKSCSSKVASSNFSGEDDCPHHNFGLYPSVNYEEHLLELTNHVDCSCSEYRIDGFGHSTDKELEDMLYLNDVASSSYVLSSGRWTVNQGNWFRSDCYLFYPTPPTLVISIFTFSSFMFSDLIIYSFYMLLHPPPPKKNNNNNK